MLHLGCDFLSKHIWKCRSDKDKLRSPVFSSAPSYLDAALLENWRAATELLSPKLRPQRFPAVDIKTPGWAAPSSPTRLLFIHHHRLRNRTGMQLRVTESPDLQVLQSSYARKRASVSSGLFFFLCHPKEFFFFKLPNTVHWCVFVWAGLTWWLWKMWGSNSCNSSLCTSTRRHPVITSHQFQQQIHPNPTPIISKNQVSRAVEQLKLTYLKWQCKLMTK